MTKDQLLAIAHAAFPDRVKESIDFDNLEMMHKGGVWRLYDKDTPFMLMLPEETLLAVFIGEGDFIQFTVSHHKAFNHYAAIKKMKQLGLI